MLEDLFQLIVVFFLRRPEVDSMITDPGGCRSFQRDTGTTVYQGNFVVALNVFHRLLSYLPNKISQNLYALKKIQFCIANTAKGLLQLNSKTREGKSFFFFLKLMEELFTPP